MQMHAEHELADLFSRSLSLHHQAYQAPAPYLPVPEAPRQPIVYTSTHYNHSAHLPPTATKAASDPGTTDHLTAQIILARHGVDASTLFPSQIELFKSADVDQQMRLIELWRISPPGYGGHALAHELDNWPPTSFQQEEAMAQLRYERQMVEATNAQEEQGAVDQQIHMDGTNRWGETVQPRSGVVPIGGGDSRYNSPTSHGAEPYMMSGYEALMQRENEKQAEQQRRSKDINSHFGTAVGGHSYIPASDPVYNATTSISGARGDEQLARYQEQQRMENQYGAFQDGHSSAWGRPVAVFGGEDEEML